MAEFGVVGVGAIAAAIVEGLSADPASAPRILLSPRGAAMAARLAGRFANAEIAADNQAVVDGAASVILAVRPQDADAVIAPLRFGADQAVVSVMAGVSLDRLRRMVAPASRIGRSIPLPAVARRQGNTPVFPPDAEVGALFRRLGTAVELADEAALEAFSAASGTVAAHFAYLDAVARWMTVQGVPAPAARGYVASVFQGLSPELTGEPDFLDLAAHHATPGGINEGFRAHLEASGLPDAVAGGLDRILARLTGRPA